MDRYLTTDEAAKIVTKREGRKFSRRTVQHWLNTGLLRAQKIGTGKRRVVYLIDPADLERFEVPKLGPRFAKDRKPNRRRKSA